MKAIDIETAEGLAEFQRLAKSSSARSRAVGKGKQTSQELLRTIAFNLALPKMPPGADESDELVLYEGDKADANLLEKYVRAPEHAWESDPAVRSVLERLAAQGDGHARELVNRIRGKHGEYDEAAAAEYWLLGAAEARAAGNEALARLCDRIAKTPEAARALLTAQPGKRMDPRTSKAQKRLAKYERETAGVAPKSDEEFNIASRLAAEEGLSLHHYRKYIADAKKARDKRNDLT